MPASSSAAFTRARSARATRHCSSGWVFTPRRITTWSFVTCSTPSTSGVSITNRARSGSAATASAPARIAAVAAVEVRVVGDRDVEQRPRPLLALVADAQDRAVRDVPHHALGVAEARGAQAHALDGARRDAGVDHVADAVLVLDDHEDPGDEVLHERLRAEADRDADDARADADRGEVHVERVEDHHERGRPDQRGDDAAQHRADRLGPQRAADVRHRRRVEQRHAGAAAELVDRLARAVARRAGSTTRRISSREMRTSRYATSRMTRMRNGFDRSSAISAARALPVMSWTVEQSHACWPGGPQALISSA